ncbi:probable disease resistance protein At5g63020 isoform X1 [Camellia sinensis]|uniref:probable disease resistance protein At5g63020 isoform X1 n=1 Tax=Camellia sinensis TaxID=4442 RepID=UPI00103680FF|nr:probable disease resistance protein At5g63020 isoform X1 [Camellia sinensis]
MFGWGDIGKILCSDGVIKTCKAGWSHVGYVIHYKKNIQKLEDEIVGLDDEWRRIDGSAHRARDDAGVIENDVWKWLMSAYGMKAEVEVFLLDMVRENKSCFNCLCPNIHWRYRLGKESKKKTACVIILKEKGAKFMTCPVSHRAPLPDVGFTLSANYEAFDSRKHIFEEIIRSLKDPSIKMIGIYGPGGVGKTTMVEEVRQLAKRNGLFHSVAMTTVSKAVEKEKVQGELASQLGLKLDEYGRAGQLLNRLRNGQKTLVILDDVWEPLDLADIGIPTTDGGNNEPLNLPDIGIPFTTGSDMGCKVVITTRKQRVCKMMQKSSELKNFPIHVLTKTEAWSLFTKVAEISVDFEIPSEAEEVCDKCGGLPVAIRAVAAALKGKGKHAWKDALRQLKNYKIKEIADIDPNLFVSLKWSYDRLEPKDARSCFLLCSLFKEDAEISIDELVRYSIGMRLLDQNLNIFDEVRDRVLAMVDVLKTSCLVLDGRDESVVKMHDIIRDVAISIAEDEKRYLVKHGIEKWPEKGRYEHYSAISLRFTAKLHEFPNELECRGLHTLVLQCSNDSPTDFPNNFFNGMENNLEVLDLSQMPIKSLPSSLPTLVKLRMLCLNGGRLMTNIALFGSLRNLEILKLKGMKKVLSHSEDGAGFSELQFLKSQPQILPGSFCNLCELRVKNCQFKFLFTHSIARGLEQLQRLEIRACKDMEEIIRNERQGDEEEIIFHHLKKMVLDGLPNLRSFYSSMKNTSSTEANNSNPSRPLFCEKMAFPALEGLTIEFVRNISGIIGDKQLKLLVQQEENESFWNLPHLRDLRITNCSKLKAIVVANKEGGPNDKPLIFRDLHSLYLSELNNLKSFYSICGSKVEEEISKPQPLFNEKVAFPALEYLEIEYVDNISGIIGDKQLKLPVQQEENESFWNLPHLRDLRISTCLELEAIVVTNKEGGAHNKPLIFRDLHSLDLFGMNNLKSFYSICGSKAEEEISKPHPLFNEKVVFPSLEKLRIQRLSNFKQIWISTPPTNSFNKLRSLCVDWCEELLYVAPLELLGSLQNLQSLEINDCKSIEEIFKTRESNAGEGIVSRDKATSEQVESIPVPPQLKRVSITECSHLVSFCSGYKLPPSVQLSIQESHSF